MIQQPGMQINEGLIMILIGIFQCRYISLSEIMRNGYLLFGPLNRIPMFPSQINIGHRSRPPAIPIFEGMDLYQAMMDPGGYFTDRHFILFPPGQITLKSVKFGSD